MNKSRVESAVQELPPRSGRSRSEVSSMRSLDNLVLPADQGTSSSSDEDIDQALSFLDPETDVDEARHEESLNDETSAAAEPELEFDPLEPDGDVLIEDLDPEDIEGAAPLAASEVVQGLLQDLVGPLSDALAEAERILGDPERVATWVDKQARRRLLSLAERFSDELRDTEMKRALTSPPPAD